MKKGHILWTIFNAALAALGGGVLAFGVLELPILITALAAVVFAIFAGAVWAWAWRSPARTRVLTAVTLISILALVSLSLMQLRGAGQIFVNTDDREKNFAQLCSVLQEHYPYLNEKNLQVDEICRRYQPLIQAAHSDTEYHNLVASMLAEFNDAHTGLISPYPGEGRLYFATGLLLDDGIVIDQVGQTAQTAGVMHGAQILAVNGLPVEQALETLPSALKSGANIRQRENKAAYHILSTLEDSLELTYQNPGGQIETVTLHRPQNPPVPSNSRNAPSGPLITAVKLPGDWGLIRIPTFSSGKNHDLAAEFDQALEDVHDAQGLILDLRGNGGGDSRLADRIAGRFFSQPFCYGQDGFRRRIPLRAWSLHFNYCVQPRGEVVSAPLVLLIDNRNMSSAEQFIAAFSESDRALIIGRPSGGSSGNPLTFPLPGDGLVRFSTGAFRTNSGLLIEGSGIQPDVLVPYTVADFQQNRDPDIQAALTELARLAALQP